MMAVASNQSQPDLKVIDQLLHMFGRNQEALNY